MLRSFNFYSKARTDLNGQNSLVFIENNKNFEREKIISKMHFFGSCYSTVHIRLFLDSIFGRKFQKIQVNCPENQTTTFFQLYVLNVLLCKLSIYYL